MYDRVCLIAIEVEAVSPKKFEEKMDPFPPLAPVAKAEPPDSEDTRTWGPPITNPETGETTQWWIAQAEPSSSKFEEEKEAAEEVAPPSNGASPFELQTLIGDLGLPHLSGDHAVRSKTCEQHGCQLTQIRGNGFVVQVTKKAFGDNFEAAGKILMEAC